MGSEQLVQFISFETPLDTEEFIVKWEQFNKSAGNLDTTLQQTAKKNGFRYIVQQRCTTNQFQFIFERGRRSSKNPEVPIKVELAGGYSILQLNNKALAKPHESKLFLFLANNRADLNLYRNIAIPNKLNIYEPYYENCRYAYILEFFTKDELADQLLQELKGMADDAEIGIYKECVLQLS